MLSALQHLCCKFVLLQTTFLSYRARISNSGSTPTHSACHCSAGGVAAAHRVAVLAPGASSIVSHILVARAYGTGAGKAWLLRYGVASATRQAAVYTCQIKPILC